VAAHASADRLYQGHIGGYSVLVWRVRLARHEKDLMSAFFPSLSIADSTTVLPGTGKTARRTRSPEDSTVTFGVHARAQYCPARPRGPNIGISLSVRCLGRRIEFVILVHHARVKGVSVPLARIRHHTQLPPYCQSVNCRVDQVKVQVEHQLHRHA